MTRLPAYDPRTVARDIPGVFDSIFPQLTPGVVAHFNHTWLRTPCEPIPSELVDQSQLQKAMLFEIGFAVGEMLIAGKAVDWDECLQVAIARQRCHFDAQLPTAITQLDRDIAAKVGGNIESMISALAAERGQVIATSPAVPGFQWVTSGRADFGIGTTLVEVKCSGRNFSASDYRQIVMYWLLSYAASVETNTAEWTEGILLNPRAARYLELNFDEFLRIISAGRTKVEILQLFASMIGTRSGK
jgi:hypothetical protein